ATLSTPQHIDLVNGENNRFIQFLDGFVQLAIPGLQALRSIDEKHDDAGLLQATLDNIRQLSRFINTGCINKRKWPKIRPYQITSRTGLGRYLGDLLSLNFIEKRTLASIRLSNNHHRIVEPL